MNLKQWLIGAAGCGATAAFVAVVALSGRQETTVVVRPSVPLPAAPVVVKAVPVLNLAARMKQPFVETTFKAEGLKRHANGNCTSKWRRDCTSYEGMRRGTVEGVLAFKRASKCKITVSGGTEKGHARMRFSHESGYKIDLMPTKCVTKYIHKTMKKVAQRSDGSPMYKGKQAGQLFANEHDTHWDVFFGPDWCVKRLIKHQECR